MEENLQEIQPRLQRRLGRGEDYVVDNVNGTQSPLDFYDKCVPHLIAIYQSNMPIKENQTLDLEFIRANNPVDENGNLEIIPFHPTTVARRIPAENFIEAVIKEDKEDLMRRISEFEARGSELVLQRIKCLYVRTSPYTPVVGSSYRDIRDWIKNKKAVINPKNDNNECFKYAVLINMFPDKLGAHKERITSRLIGMEERLCWDGLDFSSGIGYKDFGEFGKNNSNIRLAV